MAAPTATTSSGLTPLDGALPKNFSTICCTAGIRVEPPTRITSLMSLVFRPASWRALRQGSMVLWIRSSHSCSNMARDNVFTRCLGMPSSCVIYGRLISVLVELESSILAFSAASLRRCRAMGSLRRSMPFSCWNSSASQVMMRWSKSSPPRWVSPLVAFTSNTPSPSSRIEISNVPPPRSNTAILLSLLSLSRP